MQRRRFSREFKVEAVKLIRERGVPAAFSLWHQASPDLRERVGTASMEEIIQRGAAA